MGVLSEELMLYLPHRFGEMVMPKMNVDESLEMTLNYGNLYGHEFTREIAEYIVSLNAFHSVLQQWQYFICILEEFGLFTGIRGF
jgi:hypothetical protein